MFVTQLFVELKTIIVALTQLEYSSHSVDTQIYNSNGLSFGIALGFTVGERKRSSGKKSAILYS